MIQARSKDPRLHSYQPKDPPKYEWRKNTLFTSSHSRADSHLHHHGRARVAVCRSWLTSNLTEVTSWLHNYFSLLLYVISHIEDIKITSVACGSNMVDQDIHAHLWGNYSKYYCKSILCETTTFLTLSQRWYDMYARLTLSPFAFYWCRYVPTPSIIAHLIHWMPTSELQSKGVNPFNPMSPGHSRH